MTSLQLSKYLSALKLKKQSPSKAYLFALFKAHIQAVPYETTDVLQSTRYQPCSLDLNVLLNKMIQHGQGGLCVEINVLLQSALRTLGFSVTSILPYSLYRQQSQSSLEQLPRHVAAIVTIGEKRFFVDAGFGARGFLQPTLLPTDGETRKCQQYSEAFRFSHTPGAPAPYEMGTYRQGKYVPLQCFTLEPVSFSAYMKVNLLQSDPTNPKGYFYDLFLVSVVRFFTDKKGKEQSRRIKVINDKWYGGMARVEIKNQADLQQCLESLGFKLPADTTLLFTSERRDAHRATELGKRGTFVQQRRAQFKTTPDGPPKRVVPPKKMLLG
jgi:N-hydroxyarylamine O-acetyltransferase